MAMNLPMKLKSLSGIVLLSAIIEDECVPVFESTEAAIDQNKKATIEFTCKPDGIDGCGGVGDHTLTISVDYDDDIIETNEDNNKIIYEYEVFNEELADLGPWKESFSLSCLHLTFQQ